MNFVFSISQEEQQLVENHMAAGLSSRPIALLPPAQSTCADLQVNVRIFFGNIWGIFFLLRPAQSSCFTVQVNVGIFFKNAFFSSVLHSLLVSLFK